MPFILTILALALSIVVLVGSLAVTIVIISWALRSIQDHWWTPVEDEETPEEASGS